MTEHIAVMSHRTILNKILSGQKTIESRFSRVKTTPFGQVVAGDIIHFKLSGGGILGRAKVAAVEEYENLTPTSVEALARRFMQQLALSEDFLARKLESRFATLIFLTDIVACEPWSYKQEGRSGWIVCTASLPELPLATIAT